MTHAERRRRTMRRRLVLLILVALVLAQVPAACWPGTVLAALGLIGSATVMVWSALRLLGSLGATGEPRR